ncbi:MAG: hypothetical protein R2834_13525 [Rhodothermales bacterium]
MDPWRTDALIAIACGIAVFFAARRAFRPIGYIIEVIFNRSRGVQDDTPTFYDVFFGGYGIGYLGYYFGVRVHRGLSPASVVADELVWLMAAIAVGLLLIAVSMYFKILWYERVLLVFLIGAGVFTAWLLAS